MLCESVRELPTNFDGWVAEPKIDGVRALLEQNKITGRNGNDYTYKFPELKTDIDAVIDGEIVCQNESFESTASRVHTKDLFQIKLLSKKFPVVFKVFDILEINGRDLTNLPLLERKELLNTIDFKNSNYEILPFYQGQEKIEWLWDDVKVKDSEGIILKREDSRYVDKRSPNWVKLKNFKEAILEFNAYEEHPKGILLKNDNGHRVNVNGYQAINVLAILQTTGKVKAEVQYLSYNKETDAYRFPSFRGLYSEEKK